MEIPYRDLTMTDGSFTRIEYYHEENIEQPTAYQTFLRRMGFIHQEYATWATIINDSITFMELSARKLQEKTLNPMVKFAKGTDTRQWFAGSTDDLEEMLAMRFGQLPMNVLCLAHVDERKNEISGEIFRGPFVPGRLGKRGLMGAAYQEFYHAYRVPDMERAGKYIWQLQTTPRQGYAATTQLDAPDPCWPSYEALWANYWKKTRVPIHCTCYGEFGMGKSTFAATWPGPRLVLCWDPHGKDMPYRKRAISDSGLKVYSIG